MDPNKALAEIRSRVQQFHTETLDHAEQSMILEDVVQLFGGLDEWISKGGFLPADWNKEN